MIPPDFPWRAGMLFRWMGQPLCVYDTPPDGRLRSWVGDYLDTFDPDGLEPDPTDGATLGALLVAVREAWGPAFGTGVLHLRPYDATRWAVFSCGTALTEPQATEFDALLAAWNARPR